MQHKVGKGKYVVLSENPKSLNVLVFLLYNSSGLTIKIIEINNV